MNSSWVLQSATATVVEEGSREEGRGGLCQWEEEGEGDMVAGRGR